MKKITWILFLSYFGIFVLVGVVFYFRYLDKFLKTGAQPLISETVNPNQKLYYSVGNNLYAINPNLVVTAGSAERIERIQSTGEVASLDVAKNGQKFAYDAKNKNDNLEIWEVDVESMQSQKIASLDDTALSGFTDFYHPQYSPGGTSLAFIGDGTENSAIFIRNLATGKNDKISETLDSKITDFSWSPDSKKIIFCSASKQSCWTLDIAEVKASPSISGNILEVSWDKTTKIIYLAENTGNFNIFSTNETLSETRQISDLKAPKKINDFEVDSSGTKILYNVQENNANNIYYSEITGDNKIQLTSDGKTSQAVFSPSSNEIGYLKNNDGIYTISNNKTNGKKIVNLSDSNVRLLLWR